MTSLGPSWSKLTTTLTGIRYELGVLVEGSRSDLEGRSLPVLPSSLELGIGNIHRDRVGLGIDVDHIAVLDQGDGTSDLSFGSDVTDDESVRTGKK